MAKSRNVSQDIVEQILSHSRNGKKNKEIASILSMKYTTVKSIVMRYIGTEKRSATSDLSMLRENIANDRITMYVEDVAAKYKRSVRYINNITTRHPKRSEFRNRRKDARREREKKVIRKKDIKILGQSNMNKGNVKVAKSERVFETIVRDPKKQRAVSINDSKNTVVYVNEKDTRSNEEIREYYRQKSIKDIESCKFYRLDMKPLRKQSNRSPKRKLRA